MSLRYHSQTVLGMGTWATLGIFERGEEEEGDWRALEPGLQTKKIQTLICSSTHFFTEVTRGVLVHNEKGSL